MGRKKVTGDENQHRTLSDKIQNYKSQDFRAKLGMKDRKTRLAETTKSLESHRQLRDQAEEFYKAAHSAFISNELEKFHTEIAALHRWRAEKFAESQVEFAQASSSIWKGVRTKMYL